ncbi:hypothetical protein CPAR01_10758 [Colletotrichum paranaense]|uniref:Uncharacterized protein n=1 Tax=Colletotrichum paranaense TaxID=1914294 RepID=A0ABQ9S9N3_9PEZI|nr:uncharacterized protein CPAR01_10758 [Colletotrichum paranaense]KAK1531109.1 hypothetical protein CPAR01_10758 [Colletotrichum paranaense]
MFIFAVEKGTALRAPLELPLLHLVFLLARELDEASPGAQPPSPSLKSQQTRNTTWWGPNIALAAVLLTFTRFSCMRLHYSGYGTLQLLFADSTSYLAQYRPVKERERKRKTAKDATAERPHDLHCVHGNRQRCPSPSSSSRKPPVIFLPPDFHTNHPKSNVRLISPSLRARQPPPPPHQHCRRPAAHDARPVNANPAIHIHTPTSTAYVHPSNILVNQYIFLPFAYLSLRLRRPPSSYPF